MSNTKLRIISAIILTLIVVAGLFLGIAQTNFLLLIISILCLDELLISFFKAKRFGLRYNLNQTLIVSLFFYICFYKNDFEIYLQIIYLSIVINIFLLLFLFSGDVWTKKMTSILSNSYFPSFLIFLLPILCISSILFYGIWVKFIILLFVINFGMDTGAWFFGRRYGKHKLWPSVSPNKTIEGFVGGSLTAGVLGIAFWDIFINFGNTSFFLLFIFFGAISQLGDLIQSKLKRFYGIKDSSKMIPGHGGFYDRIDSLIFVVPFYSLFIYYYVN